jgi:hypothetical protein
MTLGFDHDHETRHAYGLTQAAVDEFRELMRQEYGEDLAPEAAWARAIEVMALFRVLVGPPIGDSSSAGSSIEAIDRALDLSN